MGIIYNGNVEEKELYSAYGMTVYGKENDYDWTIYPDRPREKCYISLRINNGENHIININLGNRCIFKENFDRTIDNFLYWIKNDAPADYIIENAVFKSLTCADSIFNHLIEQRKYREHQEQEQRKQIAERENEERAAIAEIENYCKEKGLLIYMKYEEVIILKALTNNVKNQMAETIKQNNMDRMKMYIDFVKKYPDNNDLRIIASGTIDEVLEYIRK
ncbi:MAG: hypothetical protein MSG78_04075 [Clostridiales bacterium]|nr:hypothetical protein [Clostridiales bacterium]